MIIDLRPQNITGREAELALEKAGLSTSRSTIPGDPRPPFNPSGLRLGTAAVTTRGFKEKEIEHIAIWFDQALKSRDNNQTLAVIKQQVADLGRRLPPPQYY